MKTGALPSRRTFAWALYDFANSAFATSVLSVIFSVYFARVLVPADGALLLGARVPGESLWGYLISTVMAFVILLSPVLGAMADQGALKRRFLTLWATAGALGTMGLFFATPERLFSAMACFFVATLGFEMSLVFYNAFLKDVSNHANAGRVSGLGFALGYIGGGVCLAVNMAMLNKPAIFGLASDDTTLPVRACMLLVGCWWFIFSIPTFLWVHDQPLPSAAPRRQWAGAFRQLAGTFKEIRLRPNLLRFLIAYVVYDDGVQTIILMASIFGAKALGFTTGQLAICFLMIQFVAFIGALVCGKLADQWSHKKVILTTLAVYVGVTIWAVVMKNQSEFWALGAIVGLILGGTQAASRSFFSLMVPADKSSEFFAFFSIIGKAGSLMGPFVFGVVAQFFGLRAGVASLLVFFVAGGLILIGVKEPSIPSNSPTVK